MNLNATTWSQSEMMMETYVLSLAALKDDRPFKVLGVRLSLDDAKALALEREDGDLKGQQWCYRLANAKELDQQHWTLNIVLREEVSMLQYRIDKFEVPSRERKSVLHEIIDTPKVDDVNPDDVTFTETDIKALSSDTD